MRLEPGNAKAVEELVTERIRSAADQRGLQESLQVAWRDSVLLLPVITMPIEQLLYNPETHRIKAQRDFDAVGDAAISSEPWSRAAQEYLGRLLGALPSDPSKVDPAFEKLEEDLHDYGQKEPGIITPSGILINGNSRCAALRRVGTKNMRVAVLPKDWSWDDITIVELDLQMRRDYKRDYSYVNFLIAVEESVQAVGPEDACHAFHLQKPTLERHLWILGTLRSLIARSKVGDSSLTLRDFEEDQGKLEELQRAYFSAQKSDPAAAERLKDGRLLALLLDKSKTDLRFVGDDFDEQYLGRQLVNPPAEATEPNNVNIPGLDYSVPDALPPESRVSKLITEVAQTRVQIRVAASVEEETKLKGQLSDLNSAVDVAIDAAGRVERLKKRKAAAVDRINTATDSLDACIQELAVSKSKNALDESALNEAVILFAETLDRFARATLRIVRSDGDGFAWLSVVRRQD